MTLPGDVLLRLVAEELVTTRRLPDPSHQQP